MKLLTKNETIIEFIQVTIVIFYNSFKLYKNDANFKKNENFVTKMPTKTAQHQS